MIRNDEMRLYTFSHYMLSPMAKGIQTLHSTVELFNKYTPNPYNNNEVDVNNDLTKDAYTQLYDWSTKHKTVISLDGGRTGDMNELIDFLDVKDNFYGWTEFREDEYSLGGLVTGISIVLPEKIYNTAKIMKSPYWDWDVDGKPTHQVEHVYAEDIEIIESYGVFSTFERHLIDRLGHYRLAK